MNLRHLLQLGFGIATHIPGVYGLRGAKTGGTGSARYCYSVWLRHLVMAHRQGLLTEPPAVVAELGPGDSLGILLAALISGVNTGYAFDIVEYATNSRNLEVFDELVTLFERREDIPGETEFPRVGPRLESYEFPSSILGTDLLERALEKGRVQCIREAVQCLGRSDDGSAIISYIVPWHKADRWAAAEGSVVMVYSQAVLEHVDDLLGTYQACHRWLKPDGVMSHQIDFSCHGYAGKWNGHWAYSDLRWKLIQGRRPYLLNRQPCSTHVRLMEECGFDIVCRLSRRDDTGVKRESLASTFKDLSDDDLTTSGAFIQSRKK